MCFVPVPRNRAQLVTKGSILLYHRITRCRESLLLVVLVSLAAGDESLGHSFQRLTSTVHSIPNYPRLRPDGSHDGAIKKGNGSDRGQRTLTGYTTGKLDKKLNAGRILFDTDTSRTAIYLCNPYIRRYRVIIHPITGVVGSSDPRNDSVTLGFGYYDETDDYKIIRMVALGDEHNDYLDLSFKYHKTAKHTKVEVYLSTTNSWKNVEVGRFPWSMFDVKSQLVFCDSVHWKAYYKDANENVMVVLAFHLGHEMFRQIKLPNYEIGGQDLIEYVGLYKENLSLFLFHQWIAFTRKIYLYFCSISGLSHPWQEHYCLLLLVGHERVWS
ncbi:hypothetical protein Salat_1646200 [Sesamum alatum]|uniref:F-box associated beta-propeller type 1 domain-containing protein n=1 Tax=Sesamum alatum TaxID=300844 RepID=A0AAE1Y7J1_9LAMI|nr:hypothetical protein Salat_1646200 [Sesamum alatum]